MSPANPQHVGRSLAWKRAFDLGLTLIVLPVVLPLAVLVAVAVRLALGSPVLFTQERPGRNREPFRLYKFRTMTDRTDPSGALLPDSDRLTAFGRFLRTTSLDELPQLWNVLIGDMSLVGPRPLLMRYLPAFTEEESQRFEVRPGITGLQQVTGRNLHAWDTRLAKDVEYAQRCSLRLDLWILFRTVVVVLTREGLQVDPGAVALDLDEERRVRADAKASSNE